MKKGIEVYADRDASGRWILVIEKKRGHLSLDEIREAARDWEWDFYLLVLDCFHDEDVPYGYDTPQGDRVILYRTDLLYEEGEH
jgi:hypothetical protein